MAFNATTDFVTLARPNGTTFDLGRMPSMDFVIMAMGRAGFINLAVQASAPASNQSTTAWIQPSTPAYSAEGVSRLWNGSAYVAATPALFADMLSSQGTSNNTVHSVVDNALGSPSNTLGDDNDVAIVSNSAASKGKFFAKRAGTWTEVEGLGGNKYTSQSSAPLSPEVGDVWVDTDDLIAYMFLNDGTNSQWVDFLSVGGGKPAYTEGASLPPTPSAGDFHRDTAAPNLLKAYMPDGSGGNGWKVISESQFQVTDNSLAAPGSGVGDNGDTVTVFNTAGTAFKIFKKVGGSWVEAFDSSAATAAATGVGAILLGVDNDPTASEGAEGDIIVKGVSTGVTDANIAMNGPKTGAGWPGNNSGWTQLALDENANSGAIDYNIPASATFVTILQNSTGTRRSISWNAGVGGDFNNDVAGGASSGNEVYGFATDIIAKRTEADGNRRILGVPNQIRTGSSGTGADPGYAIWYTTATLHPSMSGKLFHVSVTPS